jgi:glycosyltransferase involved in cell wall biosynthesis
MNLLLLHQNYPAQFKVLGPALVQAGHRVIAMPLRQGAKKEVLGGVQLHPYQPRRTTAPAIHPWVSDIETKVIRAEAVFEALRALRASGFEPDAVVAHPGWGESLFVKHVWPRTRLGVYCEFYYHAQGADTGFDPEFPDADVERTTCRLKMKNAVLDWHLPLADAALSPTAWQASLMPGPWQRLMTVLHDGVDTRALSPHPPPSQRLMLKPGGPSLDVDTPVVTFVNRNLEPYRGYHIFMRALPALLRAQPRVQVVLVGGDAVSYGSKPADGRSWKQTFIDEVRGQIPDADWARVHFVGALPYAGYLELMRRSTVHVYLTYPFVLSWSLIEAMSLGCAIVGSDTPPVREVITEGETGRLVNFFDAAALAERVDELLDDAPQRQRLGAAARAHAVAHYDLRTVCLPRQIEWVNRLAAGAPA